MRAAVHEAGAPPAEGFEAAAFVCVAGGGALVLYGLRRRSWAGLALTLAGTALLACGVSRALAPRRRLGGGGEPLGALPREVPGLPEGAAHSLPDPGPAPVASVDGPLSAEEHAEAERLAYFYALARGGGHLPPYDPWLAADDFARAAGEVERRRRAVDEVAPRWEEARAPLGAPA